MAYTPKMATVNDIRTFIYPYLDTSKMSDDAILAKLEAVETYLSTTWYEGSYPSSGKIPTILLTASKIIKEPSLSDQYREVRKIMDVSFDNFPSVKTKVDPYELSKTWEEMAYSILRSQCNIYKIKKVIP